VADLIKEFIKMISLGFLIVNVLKSNKVDFLGFCTNWNAIKGCFSIFGD
jgi:hypothetical protein